ncbi:serine hydrolase [Streptomyces sp. NPDC005134]|uniref:serine hydrolase n=1 Tax=unclassified Streptomyces TaxID=2593676 RepID=UPI0033A5D1B7
MSAACTSSRSTGRASRIQAVICAYEYGLVTDLERFIQALFRGQVVRGPLLEEIFTLPGASVREYSTGEPAAYSAGLSVVKLGGREVWGKTGGRWGYNTAVVATRDLSRALVYSVNATDAKGEGMNATAMNIVVAAFGAPSAE